MHCAVCHGQNSPGATVCRLCGAPLASEKAGVPSAGVLPTGTRLAGGVYTVGKVLGQGGFGITYLGSDTSLGRPVAIKEFFPQGCIRQGTTVCPGRALTVADYQVARQKFVEEARILAQFHHRGIVAVYTTFEENNTAYMVMEFVKGKTLLELLAAQGPLPEKEVVQYLTQAAEALHVLHQAQFLHRDIKPENLMVTPEGRVVLVDFGTARAFASGQTRRMTALLTPGYAPLEQYGQQARFGVFTDLYALGATGYHLLTGQMPVQATDRAAGVELPPPRRLNPRISQPVSAAILWALEMRADRRPQSAREFILALRGELVEARRVDAGNDHDASTPAGNHGNPCEARMSQLAAELQKPPAAPPAGATDRRIAEVQQQLALCARHSAPEPQRCPGCGCFSLQEVTGRFTGDCPVCRGGRLLQRKLDPARCPICRQGQLDRQTYARPLVFCPVCRRRPLEEERRKWLGMRIDLWWKCSGCKAEFDIAGLEREWTTLKRYEGDPFGIAANYVNQKLTTQFWLSMAPQCCAARKCAACRAAFYEFPDESMLLVHCPQDPYGAGKQTLDRCLPRLAWLRLAYGLPSHVGNARCPQCQAEFDFRQKSATLELVSCDAERFEWAAGLKGQTLPVTHWSLRSAGKTSCRPGWLCRQCSTEFDSEQADLRLVRSSSTKLQQFAGQTLSLLDWQRLRAGVPTCAQEAALRKELSKLQALQQQEAAAFRRQEEARLAAVRAELETLVKESILSGFVNLASGPEHLPLAPGEALCWNAPAVKLKQRTAQGQPYWDVDATGTLLVTTQRIVFAMPDARRWQKPLGKMHTLRIEHLKSDREDPILVIGFDGLQRPVAFMFQEMRAEVTVDGYPCSVVVTMQDLAQRLQSGRWG